MNREEILKGLKEQVPVQIVKKFDLAGRRVGLIIVDEVNGFCTAGAGNLAPPQKDAVIEQMVSETDKLAKIFVTKGLPVAALADTHQKDKPELPYPEHCVEGSGEEKLVPALQWLYQESLATVFPKACINGYLGTEIGKWIAENKIEAVVVVGICSDICVLQLVQSLLSARACGALPLLQDVVVLTEACATYDLPVEVATQIGLPKFAAHPRGITHYMGLYLMQQNGAVLAVEVGV